MPACIEPSLQSMKQRLPGLIADAVTVPVGAHTQCGHDAITQRIVQQVEDR